LIVGLQQVIEAPSAISHLWAWYLYIDAAPFLLLPILGPRLPRNRTAKSLTATLSCALKSPKLQPVADSEVALWPP
jgi:hypothetical protein